MTSVFINAPQCSAPRHERRAISKIGCFFTAPLELDRLRELWSGMNINISASHQHKMFKITLFFPGLELEIYIELNEYMASFSKRAGLKVVVHEANRVPFPDKDGVSVSAGFSTEIGMRMVWVHCTFLQLFQSIAFHYKT